MRHPDGFSAEMFDLFRAQCRLWRARAEALLANWNHFPELRNTPKPVYEFHEPELSADRSVATLPLSGELTLIARSLLEEEFIKDLYSYFPVKFRLGIEVGKTEPSLDREQSISTRWWNPHRPDVLGSEELIDRIKRRSKNSQ